MVGALSSINRGALSQDYKPEFADYALALLAGGVRGAAGLALQNRMQQSQRQQQAPILAQLSAAFAPQEAPPQMQGPGLDGMPQPSKPAPAGPSLASLAPLLLQYGQAGGNTAPFTDLLEGLTKEREAKQPKIYQTGKSILSRDPQSGAISTLYTDPQAAMKAPANYRFGDDGETLEFIPGGPADPAVIGRNSGIRRDVLVSKPMPSRAKASGGGSGGGSPWKKYGGR